jgi:DNA-binding IclR family transcriptional regulator
VTDLKDRIVSLLSREGQMPLSVAEVALVLGRPASTVRGAVRALVAAGELEPRGKNYSGGRCYSTGSGARTTRKVNR